MDRDKQLAAKMHGSSPASREGTPGNPKVSPGSKKAAKPRERSIRPRDKKSQEKDRSSSRKKNRKRSRSSSHKKEKRSKSSHKKDRRSEERNPRKESARRRPVASPARAAPLNRQLEKQYESTFGKSYRESDRGRTSPGRTRSRVAPEASTQRSPRDREAGRGSNEPVSRGSPVAKADKPRRDREASAEKEDTFDLPDLDFFRTTITDSSFITDPQSLVDEFKTFIYNMLNPDHDSRHRRAEIREVISRLQSADVLSIGQFSKMDSENLKEIINQRTEGQKTDLHAIAKFLEQVRSSLDQCIQEVQPLPIEAEKDHDKAVDHRNPGSKSPSRHRSRSPRGNKTKKERSKKKKKKKKDKKSKRQDRSHSRSSSSSSSSSSKSSYKKRQESLNERQMKIMEQMAQDNHRHLKIVAKQKGKKDWDKDPDGWDSDVEIADFSWSTWRASSKIPPGSFTTLGTDFLEQPDHVGKLIKQRDKRPPTSRNLPFLSHNPIQFWDPPYLNTELSDQQKLEVKNRRKKGFSQVNRLIGNIITWGLAHVALDQFTILHLFQYICNQIRLIDCYGVVSAQEYHNRLLSVFKRKIGAGQSFSIGPMLTSVDDKILTEMRINMLSPKDRGQDPYQGDSGKGGKGSKSKSKGKGGKGGSKNDRSWNPKRWLPAQQYHQDQSGKGGKGGKGGSRKGFICFDHDPRNGKICNNKECQANPVKQHLDTKQSELAGRFDRAKSMFEQNKGRGKP